jgi:rhodanese-related sulfurtransferase
MLRPAAMDGIGSGPTRLEPVAEIAAVAGLARLATGSTGPRRRRRGRLVAVSGAPDVSTVEPAEARQRVESGAMLLDVREPDEWTAGHAPDATWIPMRELAGRQGELPGDRPIVVVCRSGDRSGRVTVALRRAGYDAANLSGGLLAWAAAGLPVVTDAGADGTVA